MTGRRPPMPVTKRERKLLAQAGSIPDSDWWYAGFAAALADMHRLLLHGNDSAGVRRVAREAGLTLKLARRVASASIVKELKRAGVR